MAILKSTSSLESSREQNESMNSGLIQNINDQAIKAVTDLVIDLEAMHHQCFKQGLNRIDHNIIHRCKLLLGQKFKALNLFNVSLIPDTDSIIQKHISEQRKADEDAYALAVKQANELKISPPQQKPFNLQFIAFDDLPRLKLDFKPRAKSSFDESDESLDKSNLYVETVIKSINQDIVSRPSSSCTEVRRKYTTLEDGYLITLNFNDISTAGAALDRLNIFINTIESLSMDELMISQQFSTIFKVEQTNPFLLEQEVKLKDSQETSASTETNSKPSLDQYIKISVFNLAEFTPSFYVSTILKNISKLMNMSMNNSERLSLIQKKHSINSSFVCVNLNFEG